MEQCQQQSNRIFSENKIRIALKVERERERERERESETILRVFKSVDFVTDFSPLLESGNECAILRFS